MLWGDCADLLRSLPDASVDLVATDPPYGIDYVTRSGDRIENDDGPYVWFLRDAARVLKEDGSLACFCRWDVQDAFYRAIGWSGLRVRSQIVWDKRIHGMGDSSQQFAPQHEIVWFAVKGRGFRFPFGRPRSVLRCAKPPATVVNRHPTEKPEALLVQLIEAVTSPGAVVLDPFAGGGSAGVAALRTGRRFIGSEIDEGHAKRCVRRLAAAEASPGLFVNRGGGGDADE